MLILLLSILNITLVGLGFGLITGLLTKFRSYDFATIIICGLCISLALAQLLSLVIPVNAFVNLGFSLLSMLIVFKERRMLISVIGKIRLNILTPGIILLLIHSLLMMNSFPSIPDTWFYHTQCIKWIEEYGSIPGIGNLFSNLAYNSNMFIANALFSPRYLLGYPSFTLNSFLWLLSLWMMVQRGSELLSNKKYSTMILEWVVLLLIYRFFHFWLSSSGQDPATALLIFILYIQIRKLENNAGNESLMMCIIMLSGFILTIKFSHILFIFPALYWTFAQKNHRFRIWSLLLLSIIVVPFLMRNLILSGYLMYPSPFPDIFSFDWKIPLADIRFEQNLIRSWAFDSDFPVCGERNFYSSGRIIGWLGRIGTYNQALLVMLILSFLSLFKKPFDKNLNSSFLHIFYIFLILSMIFWFFSAPAPRFIMGIMLLAIIIPVDNFLNQLKAHSAHRSFWIVAFYILLLFTFSASRYTTPKALSSQGSIIKPVKPPQPSSTVITLNNVKYNYIDPENIKSYDLSIPASPQYREGLVMRGTDIKQGYKIDLSLRKGGPEIIRRFYESKWHAGQSGNSLLISPE